MNQYLFIDQAGNLNKNDPDSYFVIGGILSPNYPEVKDKYHKLNKILKEKYNIAKEIELKDTHLSTEEIKDIFFEAQKVEETYIVALVVKQDLLNKKKRNIQIYYNYLLGKMLEYLINKNLVCTDSDSILKIHINNKNIKREDTLSVEIYLKILLNIQKNLDINIKTSFISSSRSYLIQLANIISNVIWKISSNENKFTEYYKFGYSNNLRIITIKNEIN